MKKASTIILINSKREFLLQLRDEKKSIPYPGYWSFFGGEIEKNESPLKAIKREVLEEIGINLKCSNIKKIQGIYVPKHYLNPHECFVHVFRSEIDLQPDRINLTEGQDARYFRLEELQEIKFPYIWLDFTIKNKYAIFNHK